ncbi:TMV resistance protein N-like [Malus sylvestris]|uniref:TMV resistance protein N-like n=1 Tax=Malus sylvestris TaxID=3752 RepID=UPI0021ACC654|nr:TMV resistance protein N-like [Malus sylvestris]
MDSLEFFSLGGCSNLKRIPEFGVQMKNVFEIHLEGTAIKKIPSSIGHLVGLKYLYLRNCKNLLNLPRAICNLKSLRWINVKGCSKLDKLPGDMDHLERLECGETMTEPLVGMKNLKELYFECELDAKAREGWGLLRLLGLGKSRPDPPCWGLVLSSLNRLFSLTYLELDNCNLREGDIPDDIGCLPFLERLELRGNNFVSLPESIRRLSKLKYLDMEGCKSLQELPPLPSSNELCVNVKNSTSLKRLTDPSKLSSRFTNLYDCDFTCKNCIALVQDEGWINTILSRIPIFACYRAEQFLFKTYFSSIEVAKQYADFNSVKKCGARLVYEQDLEELKQTLKILKRTHEYRYSDEEASSGPGSANFNDTKQIHKRYCY